MLEPGDGCLHGLAKDSAISSLAASIDVSCPSHSNALLSPSTPIRFAAKFSNSDVYRSRRWTATSSLRLGQ
jgi:hypothetical protein